VVADHRVPFGAPLVQPDDEVVRRAALAARCVVDLEALVAELQALQVVAVPCAAARVEQRAVERHALRQLEAPFQRHEAPQPGEQDQREQREVRDQQRQLPAQRRVHDQRGEQVDAETGEHEPEHHDPAFADDAAGQHDRAEQGQPRQRAAQRAEVGKQGVCLHGGLLQTSFIQSRPLVPLLPFAPKLAAEFAEPQLVSTQLPLVAKLRTFSFAFR
jgi:hypothetical protein